MIVLPVCKVTVRKCQCGRCEGTQQDYLPYNVLVNLRSPRDIWHHHLPESLCHSTNLRRLCPGIVHFSAADKGVLIVCSWQCMQVQEMASSSSTPASACVRGSALLDTTFGRSSPACST